MKCDLCGKIVERVFVCSDCGAVFCEKCGNVKKKLCRDCENLQF